MVNSYNIVDDLWLVIRLFRTCEGKNIVPKVHASNKLTKTATKIANPFVSEKEGRRLPNLEVEAFLFLRAFALIDSTFNTLSVTNDP